jgi:glutathione S-transferase
MALTLYYHPFSSYCFKALIALYENGTPFTPRPTNLYDPESAAELKKLWPIGKFPVLHDAARQQTVPESSIIIEYLALHYPGTSQLVPTDPDLARQARMRDRFYDFYVMDAAGKVIANHFRPADQKDAIGVEAGNKTLATAYAMIEQEIGDKTWALGEIFTMADCAAAPALFYADMVAPLPKNATAYLLRLMKRPSFNRVLKEAEPHLMDAFPYKEKFRASIQRVI